MTELLTSPTTGSPGTRKLADNLSDLRAQVAANQRGWGLHSSTFRLNLSAFCGIGVHSGVVQGGVGVREVCGVFRVYFVSETAQVELRSGRVEAPAARHHPHQRAHRRVRSRHRAGRGLHSSTSHLNLSRL